jgi:hypothetical protein
VTRTTLNAEGLPADAHAKRLPLSGFVQVGLSEKYMGCHEGGRMNDEYWAILGLWRVHAAGSPLPVLKAFWPSSSKSA